MRPELQLKKPIDDVTFAVIREIHHATAALGYRAMLVGATARIILIEHVCGLAAGRATKDIDFAFAIETWEQFEALRQHLLASTRFKRMRARFTHFTTGPQQCRTGSPSTSYHLAPSPVSARKFTGRQTWQS
ncbi:hypothetical protein [Massilia scottii]|uniref:hypothetical protein n=1 Tax=Massilia scottii TaxID=3057166 RepID=UPI002796D2F7|nr:hypothetical protein [Massilia sp. CCM 9029]MDQ1830966.1 hypothetical protein [Massilia sp. CCM 9029]